MGERLRIGKRVVDGLPLGATVWDTEVKGFGVRRQRGATSYVLKTRTRGGRQVWVTIGKHGSPWTAETARGEARRLLRAIEEGRDPAAERQAERAAPTVALLCDRFLVDVERRRKERTAADYRRLVERHIRPEFGRLKLAELTRARVAAWHSARAGTPYEANRALAVLRRMLNLGRRWGLLEGDNPAAGIELYPEKPRDRVARPDELARIGRAMGEMPIPDGVRRAIVLLATTGCRSGEARTLRWEDVDLAAGVATLRDTKNGERRTLGLSALATAALAGGETSGGFVCPAVRDERRALPQRTLATWWQAILDRAEVQHLRIHDLRHGLATQAARDGASAILIRDLLGHKTLAMANRYVARVDEEARMAQRRAGAAIGAAIVPAAPGAVVELKGRRRG